MQHNIAWALAMCKLADQPDDERAVECYNALPVCDQLDVDRQVASIIVGVKNNEIKNQIDKIEKKKDNMDYSRCYNLCSYMVGRLSRVY